jgi:hypothetical protein
MIVFAILIVLYSLGGAATRAAGNWSSDFEEGSAALLWPLYWSCIGFGAVVIGLYLVISGAAWVAMLRALDLRRHP